MTVPSTTAKSGPYTGDGTTKTFTFSIQTQQASDVRVVRTETSSGLYVDSDLTFGVDYTVNLSKDQSTSPGGSVTLTTAPTSTQKVTVLRGVPITQSTSIPDQGGFYPSVIEARFDRLTMQIQQLAELVNRTPLSSTAETAAPAFGTMAVQNATLVKIGGGSVRDVTLTDCSISGGTVDGVTLTDAIVGGSSVIGGAAISGCLIDSTQIGQSSPSAGKFTTLEWFGSGPTHTGMGELRNYHYTPTITPVTNIASATPSEFKVQRIGDIWHCSGHIDITATANATPSALRISLPVAADITATGDLSGVGVCGLGTFCAGAVWGNPVNDCATMNFISTSTSALGWEVSFTYKG